MYGWVTYFDCCWPFVRELDLEPTYWSTQVRNNRSIHLTWPTSLCLDTLSLRSQRIVSQPLRSAATPEFWCHLTHLTVNDSSVVKQSFFWQVKVIEHTVGTAVPAHVLRLAGTSWQCFGSIVAEINKQECPAMFELCWAVLRHFIWDVLHRIAVLLLWRIEPHLFATGMASRWCGRGRGRFMWSIDPVLGHSSAKKLDRIHGPFTRGLSDFWIWTLWASLAMPVNGALCQMQDFCSELFVFD